MKVSGRTQIQTKTQTKTHDLKEGLVRIETPYNVPIEYELAPFSARILAALVDAFFKGCYFILLWKLGFLENQTIAVLLMLPFLFYNFIFETVFNGQTLGKMATDIRVIRLDGTPPTPGNFFLRWLLMFVDGFPFMNSGLPIYAPGIVIASMNKNFQRLGDLATGMVVVKVKHSFAFQETIFREIQEGYVPTFPQVAQLNDRDFAIINDLLLNSVQAADHNTLKRLADKVKEVTGIQTNMPDEFFLRRIIQDYNYVVNEMGEEKTHLARL